MTVPPIRHTDATGRASESTDPFDDLLTLEDTLYTSAYELGTQDGARTGRIEGRIFGLEKGFDKFAALGALQGRAVIWGARLPPSSLASRGDEGKEGGRHPIKSTLPILPPNDRLHKHVSTLHGLTDPLTFSTLNTEDAVADYDDRFKRAGAKAKIIERILNESESVAPSSPTGASPEADGDRDGRVKGRRVQVSGEGKRRKGEDSMEDFAGSRFMR